MTKRAAFAEKFVPSWKDGFLDGNNRGFSVLSAREHIGPDGVHYAEFDALTPYYQRNMDDPLIGHGRVRLSGSRNCSDLELWTNKDGQPDRNLNDVVEEEDLVDASGRFVALSDVQEDLSGYLSCASQYPHVADYSEFEELRMPLNKRMGLSAPNAEDYQNYLSGVADQMRKGMTFIGRVQEPKDLFLARSTCPKTKDELAEDLAMQDVMELS